MIRQNQSWTSIHSSSHEVLNTQTHIYDGREWSQFHPKPKGSIDTIDFEMLSIIRAIQREEIWNARTYWRRLIVGIQKYRFTISQRFASDPKRNPRYTGTLAYFIGTHKVFILKCLINRMFVLIVLFIEKARRTVLVEGVTVESVE